MNQIIHFSKRLFYSIFCPIIGRLMLHRNKFINVFCYHDIVRDNGYSFMRTNINVFKHQMEWLVKNGYETLRFDDLNVDTLRFKKKRVLIAFDDGWRSNYSEIFEYMKGLGLKYNIFLTMGEINNNPEYLTWDMVREMHKSGLCGFGAHSFTHPDMSDLHKIDIEKEVNQADKLFEKELGYQPIDFCYPFGYYSEESNLGLEIKSQYQRIYTSQNLFSYKQNGRIVMGRNAISTVDSDAVFHNKVKGYENAFYSFRRKVLGE